MLDGYHNLHVPILILYNYFIILSFEFEMFFELETEKDSKEYLSTLEPYIDMQTYDLTASFNSLPGLKAGILEAGI
jgi:hypothetical protein